MSTDDRNDGLLLTGCQVMLGFIASTPQLGGFQSTFNVLTCNPLHGLAVSELWVRQGETDEQQRARFTLRIKQLAKAPLTILKLDGLKLSGPLGGYGGYAGVQFGELRYALLAEVKSPATGLTYLVATMYLHSAIERDAKVLHERMEAHSQGHLQHYDQLMAELKMDEHCRQTKMDTLMNALQHRQMHRHYVGVIFGGDLNLEAESTEYRQLWRAFTDTVQIATGIPMWDTYDTMKNPSGRSRERSAATAFAEALAQELKMDQDEAVRLYRHAIGLARGTDFLFNMTFRPTTASHRISSSKRQ
ncbi:MAG: hypothetical protein ABI604_16330 [Nitrospirota bacterium]